ncbi:DegT/DnrJ/EryC1/StrS family aminotransferase [Paramagnetospirillum magneticum]|uniref:Predicted pyridoxal phosphate-dependent enzyme n=1 Tax=Paramagnetospirillum magneticum (strain ATCC 700264 / AMB-1) TaxID=342108 RepID=Q2WB93_PARM1|nr:DegT/DnrJ/EryC1/StrS family aminotransferase [Paramagnetospirillum magneticum]BAE48882.1 Predicted pyridoxal phosphate-dependent enzyme [Paramagnetospirillum magneticum AMB-1]
MIPLCVPNLTGNEARYLQECVDSTFVSSVGPFVDRLEDMVAAAAGSSLRAVATSAGTTGLHAALTAVGVGRDDLVIMPAFTFVASANAVAHCGATPWLLDVTAESWTLDPALLERVLQAETVRDGDVLRHQASGRRVAAVLPVHVLGCPADMDAILAVARAHDLKVVADAAAALGSRYRGRPIAQLGADLSVVSFNGNKTVTAGGGGAVIGTDPDLLDLVRHLTTTARVGADYLHDRVGFNYRMTNLQAAVGCAQLERLEEFVAAKRRIRAAYDAAFAGRPGISPFPQPLWAESECWFSGFVLDRAERMAALRTGLRERGVDARPFWRPMHLQPAFAEALRTPMTVTDSVWNRIVTLPCSTALTEAEQRSVVAAVEEALR